MYFFYFLALNLFIFIFFFFFFFDKGKGGKMILPRGAYKLNAPLNVLQL
jgi:hypothetical protein